MASDKIRVGIVDQRWIQGRTSTTCIPASRARGEVRQFLDHVQNEKPDWHSIFVTAIHTGVRIGELLAMKWANVDWEQKTYSVTENLTRAREFEEPKTIESCASVPLSAAAIDALKRQKAMLEARRQWRDPGLREDLIFVNTRGKPHDYATIVYKVFKPLLKAAGLRDINFHILRHTCASLLIASGASMKEVQGHLRHSRIEITMNTYAHLYPDSQAATAERLNALLAG
ncbi:MAG: site-specific integrase [Candidatus Latescibacterota bacterium]|nr:site-specific integrase [Candidatus Latescibacterota bacterium]